MNILIVAGDFGRHVPSGPERVIREVCKRLATSGHRVTILTREDEGAPSEAVDGMAVARYKSETTGVTSFHWSEVRNAREAAASQIRGAGPQIDVMHAHQPLAGLGAVRGLSRAVPMAYTFHGPWSVQWEKSSTHPLKAAFARYLLEVERAVMKRARRVVVLSTFMQRLAENRYRIDPAKITVIPPGVDGNQFRPARASDARRSLGLPVGGKLVGFAGRLSRDKGIDRLLKAFALVTASTLGLRLAVAGTGPDQQMLQSMAARLGIGERVHFLGPVADMRTFFSMLDLVVIPSRIEPFGLVVLEALACGRPVLSVPRGGPAEVLRRFDARLLLRNDSIEEIARGILHALSSDISQPAFSRTCRAFAVQNFSWEDAARRHERLYQELCET